MDNCVWVIERTISVVNIAPLLMFTSHHLIPVINRISVGLNSFVGDQISGHPEEIDNTVTLHQPTYTIFNKIWTTNQMHALLTLIAPSLPSQ